MSFISDVKFLTNLFRTKETLVEVVDELEKDCTTLRQNVSKLRTDYSSNKNELEHLVYEEDELRKKVENLKENIDKHQKKIYEIHQLESVEFIRTLISENEYEIYKLNLLKKGLTQSRFSGRNVYMKNEILDSINFTIQEFAAKEGISYEKLKNALHDINVAWFETFNYNKAVYFEYDSSTTSLLLTSFMMIGKKEKLGKVPKKL